MPAHRAGEALHAGDASVTTAHITFTYRKGDALVNHTYRRTGRNRNAIRSQINALAKALSTDTKCPVLPLISNHHPSIEWE